MSSRKSFFPTTGRDVERIVDVLEEVEDWKGLAGRLTLTLFPIGLTVILVLYGRHALTGDSLSGLTVTC